MFRDLGIAFAIGLLIGLKRDGEQRNLEATEQLAGARRYELPGLAFNHWKTQTFIAGRRNGGLFAPWIIDTPMTKTIFEIYVETQLAPTLEAGDVVICDNLSSHKSERAKEIFKERGTRFLFLSPYGPDLNPIEMAVSKLKAHLRRIGARTMTTSGRPSEASATSTHPPNAKTFTAAGYGSDYTLNDIALRRSHRLSELVRISGYRQNGFR